MILEKINKPNDIKQLSPIEYNQLADEIRGFLIEKISKTGGHLASNLGVVELTMALHLAFNLPQDKLIWDVGHQSYTHKILTGRKNQFDQLRKFGGMSGFPKRNESHFDAFDTGHSSTSISAGLGLVKARDLRENYELNGGIFHNTNDTEVISYAITEQRLIQPSIEKAVEQAMYKFKGAYSLVIMSPKKLIAARDPQGFRPLCMGETETGAIVFASESCALDSIGARFIRDVEPGEIIIVDKNGAHSLKTHCGQKTSMCVFEYVYIARPDSVIEGSSVHQARLNAGKKLWQESPVEADVVVGVPDSGLDAALGFSMASGIPYGVGFIKNRYVGRTFIQPSQSQRSNSVRIKLNVIKDVVKGKRVVLIDDSIVRGTTSARIVNLIREAGATEVHMRISSPPFTNPCYFGIDIDSKENLIACQMSIEEIAKEIGADSLGYLSIEGVKNIAENAKCNFCTGCFTGEYPIRVPKEMPKDKFERKIDE